MSLVHLNDHRAFAPAASNDSLFLDLEEARKALSWAEGEKVRLLDRAAELRAVAAGAETPRERERHNVNAALSWAAAKGMDATIEEHRALVVRLEAGLQGQERWA